MLLLLLDYVYKMEYKKIKPCNFATASYQISVIPPYFVSLLIKPTVLSDLLQNSITYPEIIYSQRILC